MTNLESHLTAPASPALLDSRDGPMSARRTTNNGVKPATRKLFGTDGVRGVANVDPMTPEMAMRLGMAVAYQLRRTAHGGRPRVVIGKDTRLSGYMFETAMAAGICSMGVDVMLVGPLPTPGIAFITSSMRADAGVVISASHNPYQDNGIKIFARDGFKLPDATELELERLMESPELASGRSTAAEVGKAFRIDDAVGRYVVFLKAAFPRDLTLDGQTVVVDCANGAAYRVAPAVFQELGAKVVQLGCHPDGKNINHKSGALHPEAMARAVKRHGALLGIALDGDADRVIICDERGEVVDGDQIMAICARRMIAGGTLNKRTLVATVMSNLGLQKAVEQVGGHLLRTPVGDRYVVEQMRQGGYNFGGEQSGHLVFLDRASTGDGVVAALELVAIMLREGRPLSELAGEMTRYPQVLVNVEVAEKRPLEELPRATRAISKIEQALAGEGRVLVRFSGTEAKVRVMVEGPPGEGNDARIRAYADEIAGELKSELSTRSSRAH
jgi:phosphoglucosamine mutase